MNIEEIALSEIKPYEKNPRKNDSAVNGVAESIKQFGFQQPIVIDSNNIIVVGHTRYKAAEKLGLKTVPCVRASDLTPDQVKTYRILDNKLNELATWDFQSLSDELTNFQFDFGDFDVYLPAFTYDNYLKETTETTDNTENGTDDSFNEEDSAKKTYTPPQQKYEYDQQKVEREFVNIQDNTIRLTVHFIDQNDIVEFGQKIGLNLSPETKICYF